MLSASIISKNIYKKDTNIKLFKIQIYYGFKEIRDEASKLFLNYIF